MNTIKIIIIFSALLLNSLNVNAGAWSIIKKDQELVFLQHIIERAEADFNLRVEQMVREEALNAIDQEKFIEEVILSIFPPQDLENLFEEALNSLKNTRDLKVHHKTILRCIWELSCSACENLNNYPELHSQELMRHFFDALAYLLKDILVKKAIPNALSSPGRQEKLINLLKEKNRGKEFIEEMIQEGTDTQQSEFKHVGNKFQDLLIAPRN